MKGWTNNFQAFAIDFRNPTEFLPASACIMDWSGSLNRQWCYSYAGKGTANDFGVKRAADRLLSFGTSTDLSAKPDINDKIGPIYDGGNNKVGWSVINGETDAIESYDLSGFLLKSVARNGQLTTYAYSDASTPVEVAPRAGLLLTVTDAFNRELNFTYDSLGRLATMVDPAGGIFRYASNAEGNFTSVTYPDGKVRTYLYNEKQYVANSNQPTSMTGIVDENNNRYATFNYDSSARAIVTEHAGGAEKNTLTFGATVSVQDALGTIRSYSFAPKLNVIKLFSISQPGPTGTSTVTMSNSYDANGNVSLRTDFKGVQTSYTYDLTRNLELTRVEAVGTSVARTITTAWHSKWRLPVLIAEPKRITTFSYDDNGNLLSKSVQATTDLTGTAGANATKVGAPLIWVHTYNALGQVLTTRGPRTDVIELTTYSYDEQGNLTSKTNAAGHVTNLANYDAHGHVGRITDPNGLMTDYTYLPRGWLASVSIGGEVTSYEYDGVGQVTKTTLPDGSSISYVYDPAHRLIGISDSAGNSIAYTLDPIGNRINEQTKDVNGALSRQIVRAYDALNRLKLVTGALQ
jgi:YD repeat-containing protein